MSKHRYEQAYYDEWIHVPRRSGILIACCDCSLVHDVHARVRDGRVEVQFRQADRNTAALRRGAKRP